MWEFRDLPGEVIDITPLMNSPRGEEIEEYLKNNHTDRYVIIDDQIGGILPEQLPNFIKCSGNFDHEDCFGMGFGLTRECANKAIKILNDGNGN
jgi:hypothetical protein